MWADYTAGDVKMPRITQLEYSRKLKLRSQDFTINLYCAILKPVIFESYDKQLILAFNKLKKNENS